jgi:single-stranded-DNA-specific exonuclease
MYAAGLTMKVEKVQQFIDRFEEVVSRTITPDLLIPQVDIDEQISLDDINDKFFRILKQFQPFGPGNMSPVFVTENVTDNGDGRLVGPDKEHIKLSLSQNDKTKVFPAIAFQLAEHYRSLHEGKPFDICYTITENVFRGETTLQIRVKDIKFDLYQTNKFGLPKKENSFL